MIIRLIGTEKKGSAGQKAYAGQKTAGSQNTTSAQSAASSTNGRMRQRESTAGYKVATAAMVIGVAVLLLYERQKNFPAGEAITPQVVLFILSQLIGLLLVCLKNSRVGAVICMPSSFVAGTIPMPFIDSVLHIFSEDHTLLVIVTLFGTMALWVVLCTIPWSAADPGEKKKRKDR